MEKKKRKAKYKISWQFALIFAGVLGGTIAFFLLCNNLFLESYYNNNKVNKLKQVYDYIENGAKEDKLTDTEFIEELSDTCNANIMGIIIVDLDSESLFFFGSREEVMKKALWDKLFINGNPNLNSGPNPNLNPGIEIERIEENDNYQLVRTTEDGGEREFIEMWGTLNNDDLFLIRVASSGIQTTVDIANRFILFVSLAAIVISCFIVSILARRLSKPILQLADISQRMSNLDFEAKYEGKEKNEIAILGENINMMSRSMEKTISDLKAANIELQRDIEKRQQIEDARREFISNVSHELKTPLAIIQGYAEGLIEGISDDEESRNYYCNVISDEANRMNNMVKSLLEIQELESGIDAVVMERFDIVAVIASRIRATDVLTKGELKVEFDYDKPIYVWGDSFKVEDVITNLLSNAINHCSGEKRITITIEEKNDVAHIEVFNTGENISEEHIGHIFEKFYKADKARTRQYGGSGIGLSIVKAIMDSMNQKVGVVNKENGVTFWFELDSRTNIC